MDNDVGVFAADYLIAPAGMSHDGDLVPHGAGGNEHRRFLAQGSGGQFFQLPHRRVVPIYIVAHRAAAMAVRISSVGRVTVSLLKSIKSIVISSVFLFPKVFAR